jgi:putative ABC transport system ATP-binding protein
MNLVQEAELSIKATGVRKSFTVGDRRVHALDGADIELDQPGFYAIMGASGSGKSTLLHLLAGLDNPDAGEILVSGTRVDGLSEKELTLYRRRKIGVIFQQFNLLPTLTALENVMLPGVLDRLPEEEIRERATQLLSELGLEDRMNHRPEALSGGEQQRVAIARSLYYAPNVLLADEPTGNLDSNSSDLLWSHLGELAERRRMIVLMVTHEADAAAHCRRAFVLRDGRMAGMFDVEGLDSSELAARAAALARPS